MNKYQMKEQNAGKEEISIPEGVERLETRKAYVPSVDIIDNDNETTLLADMPGVDCDNIDITLEKDILTIKGKPNTEEYPGRSLAYSEYGIGDFQRSFSITDDVDRDGISASVIDGVLTVKIPKTTPTTKKIAVSIT